MCIPSASATIFHLCMLFDSCLNPSCVTSYVRSIFPLAREDISLLCRGWASVFIVSPPRIHISLGICVRGCTYHGDTHITVTPEAPFTSDKIKINTSVVYIMQAASCIRKGEYCCPIWVSVIIAGYVRFRFKLNLEAILESKAILLQKSCSGIKTKGVLWGCVSRNL